MKKRMSRATVKQLKLLAVRDGNVSVVVLSLPQLVWTSCGGRLFHHWEQIPG